MLRTWFTVLVLLIGATASGQSLRFYGHGSSAPDLDRVKIRIDNPNDNNPGPPADIGSTDFTIEFWLRPDGTRNGGGVGNCGPNAYSWIEGNIIFDRDRFSQGRAFGISLGNGRIAFGVKNGSGQSHTLCGTTDLRVDNAWHHVAVQRQSDGLMEIYVDGVREAFANGPDGDLSYPDGGTPISTAACGGPCTNSDPFVVLGAEKHDVGSDYPAYAGWLTELRLSTSRRYSANFAVPSAVFVASEPNTVALYHFDEGTGNTIVDANGDQSPGERRFGGSAPAGPEWSTETPFGTSPGGSPGTVRLAQSAYTTPEQDLSVTISVTRAGGSSGSATVTYTVAAGTATAAIDFDATTSTLTWNNGEMGTKSFSVVVRADTETESNETVNITLSNATGATLGTPSSAVLTITDDDTSGGNPPPSNPPPSGGNASSGGGGGGFDPLTLSALLLFSLGCVRRRLRR